METTKLHFKTFGQGDPLVILHGLFGTLDNWQTLGKQLAEDYMVFLVDLRNHGRSPHSPEHSYPLMAADLVRFMEDNWLHRAHILGHSMGGKVAMQLAMDHPDLVDKLVVVDIGPKAYPGGHELILNTLAAVDPSLINSRAEAEALMKNNIPDVGIRQFLMKNLSREKTGGYRWKMNLSALTDHYPDILTGLASTPYEGATLFIRGSHSDYIKDDDWPALHQQFPAARLETISGAGHWVHAEQPADLYKVVTRFLEE